MKFRRFIFTSALTVSAWQVAQAADDSSLPQREQLPDSATLPNILVTGDTQHLPQSFDGRYASTQVLTRADLDHLSPSDPSITQALATLPGVTVSQNGGPGSLASVSIRGSSGNQVAVFIDGIRVGSATTGQAAWADLPTSAFDRVEVISGPAAASFGADAVGGVIQLFTNRASNQPNQTTISMGGGSNKTFDTQFRTSGSIPSTGPLAALAGLTYSLGLHDYNTAGIDATQPWAYGHEDGRNPYHAQDVDARLGYAHDNWSISTFALYHRSDLSYDNAGGDDRQLDHQLTTGLAFHLDITPFTQFDQSVGYATDRQFLYANNPAIPTDEIDSTRLSMSTSLTHQERGLTLFSLPLSGETKLAYDFTREQAFLLQRVRYLLHNLAAGSGYIGERGHDPNRRCAKGQNADQLDTVPRRPAHQEVVRQLPFGRIHALHLSYLFNHEPQRDVHHGLISLGAAYRGGERNVTQLPDQSAGQSGA